MSYDAFVDGVRWVCTQLEEAARTVENEKRGSVQAKDGRMVHNAVLESGQPAFALKLRQMSEALMFHGRLHAKSIYKGED